MQHRCRPVGELPENTPRLPPRTAGDGSEVVDGAGPGQLQRAVEARRGLGQRHLRVVPRRHVGQQQPPGARAGRPTSPQSAPVRCRPAGLSSPARNDASAQQQVGALRPRRRGPGRARCRRCRPAVAPSTVTRSPNAGTGCSTGDRAHRERARPRSSPAQVRKSNSSVHAGVERQVVGPRHPVGGAGRPPHGDPRLRPGGVVLAQHVVAGEVEAVVGVQVAEEDRVDRERVGVAVQRAERAAAEVEQDPPGAPLPGRRCGRPRAGSSSPGESGPG